MLKRHLYAELLKCRHTPLLPAHIMIPLLTDALFLGYYAVSPWDTDTKITAFFQTLGIGLPVLSGIFAATLAEQEQLAGSLQNILTLRNKTAAFTAKLVLLLFLALCALLTAAGVFAVGFGAEPAICLTAAVLLCGAGIPLYVWFLIAAFRFGKSAAVGAGIVSGLLGALFLTGMGDRLWRIVFVTWTARIPAAYLFAAAGDMSARAALLSALPFCAIFTVCSVLYYIWWAAHFEGSRPTE